ncbi:hypothetical protein [Halocalculus aciditolerans]|uniref:Uncharacterized protein n=1 Tax=Halocalculus aciditolerans TaxID=1383812 RepID=A0A830FGZ5_9EURY|nr:hypothetical protein [Halocalculus aciditolerans]GGL73446.1 hypothetical protein GCM10009039_34440 [Halocalculus aciditolerans]
MADSDTDWIDRADGKSAGTVLFLLIASPFMAAAAGISEATYALTQIYTVAAGAFAEGIGDFIAAFTSSPAEAMSGVIEGTVQSLNTGPWAVLGVFQIPIFAAMILVTAWLFLEFLDRRNSDIPFTGADIPLLGNDSDGQEE